MSEVAPNMYRYDEFDARFVAERTAQFKVQVERRLKGELTEDQFKPLRLMNGLYLQLHAYMLRVAMPVRLAEPVTGSCASWRWIAPHLRQGLRPLHDAPRTCSSTGSSWPTRPTS